VLAPVLRVAEYFAMPSTRDYIPIMLHTRMDSLMTGCLIALLYRDDRFREFLKRAFRWGLPEMAALFMFVVSPLLADRFRGAYLAPVGWPLENFCAGIVMLWLVERAKSPVGRLFNSRFLTHIGVISYSLYLWQQLFLTKQSVVLGGMTQAPALLFIGKMACVFIVAECSYFLIERPMLSLRRRLAHTEA
jgi:peptidoglycan/LPS O-acetylase OafA/YrhL